MKDSIGEKHMPKTPEYAKEHYTEKVKKAKEENKYAKGIAAFLGVDVDELNPDVVEAWESFAEKAEDYADLWFDGYKSAMLKPKRR